MGRHVQKRGRRSGCLACVCAATVASARIAHAATDTWSGASGNWSDTIGWSLARPPQAGDSASLTASGTNAVTLTLDTSTTFAQFGIDAARPVTFSQAANSFTVSSEFVGSSRAGTVILSGGTQTLTASGTNGLFLGYRAGSSGSFTLGNATLNILAANAYVGFSGNGAFAQTGGSASVQNLSVAYDTTASSTYSQSAGSMTVAGQADIAYLGAATASLSGGVLSTGSTVLANQAASQATFNQSGGTHTTSTLSIGLGGSAAYAMSNAATLSVANFAFIGVGSSASGQFTQTGGSTTVGGSIFIGDGGSAEVDLSGGTLNTPGVTYVGYVGYQAPVALFNQTGGAFTTGDLQVAANSGVLGQYLLAGGSAQTHTFSVGNTGAGVFTQSGGAMTVAQTFIVGLQAGAGTANLTGGSTLAGSATIGQATGDTGSLNLAAGGALAVAGSLVVGDGGAGSLTQSGGSLVVNGTTTIGNTGRGIFALAGGNATLNGSLTLAAGTSSTASLALTGGTLDAASLSLGIGSASVTVSNGAALNVAGSLTLATNTASTAITLAGGTLSAGSLTLGGNLNRLHWTAGTLSITGSNGLSIDTASPTGNAWTLTAAQSLNVVATESIDHGAFIQTAGSHTAGLLAIGAPGVFTLNGGVFTGAASNSGLFNAAGGAFNGSLVVSSTGTVVVSADFAPTLGVKLAGNATVNPAVTLAGGLDVEGGSLTLNGGSLGSPGAILNNGAIIGFGTLAGDSLTNNGSLIQTGGNVTVGGAGANVNAGLLTLEAGRQLILSSSLTNAGSLSVNNAVITGSATLTNSPLGTLRGSGTILSPLVNAGTVLVENGTLNVAGSFTNTGVIQLAGVGNALTGGALINPGTIQGSGAIGSPITNTGTIEPLGGSLALFGTLTNTGLIRAATGNKLLLSTTGFTNAGTISLTGGTFDTGTAAVTNTGQITGYGTLATGGLLNTGSVTLAGGTATINGSLVNAAGGTIRISQTPAVFTGAFVNNGSVIVQGASVTFAGGFTNNGLYASDPSTTTAPNFTLGKSGALVGGAGDAFVTTGGLYSTSTGRAAWDTSDAALAFIPGGSSTAHTITLTGTDFGPSTAGFTDNFAWGTLQVGVGQSLSLVPMATDAALYVHTLLLDGAPTGTSLPAYIASHLLSGNGADLYYDPAQPANAYLGDETYPLGGGGVLAPAAVPEPSSLTWVAFAAFGIARSRRRAAGRASAFSSRA